ncbi:MAG TPA: serine hydrolase domain-containing protein [Chitinophagales bacterium]|nr:serine hydrolase domain-containing protein [Chitinophagales bacterium]
MKINTFKLSFLCFLLATGLFSQRVMAVGNPGETTVEETVVPTSMEVFSERVAGQIDSFYRKRVKNDHFNGCVMVAKDGKPIYSAAFGYGNLTFKDTLTIQSSIQLASVSKTFTSTAILLLAEQGFLSLDDSVQKFFPDFPYKGITVDLLLSHRTGLPDYTYWDNSFLGLTSSQYLTNEGLMNVLATKKPAIRCKPDHMFIYCNTNYAILASIVERVTGTSFKQFMHDVVFAPLGMSNTYVFAPEEGGTCCTISYDSKGRHWKDCPADGVVGDKGIYSSVEDMLKWDNALRTGLILKEETLMEAYKPRSLDRYSFAKDKTRNYGYGWRMTRQPDKSYVIYHNGFWHGSNNVFARDLKDGFTIIVLGNKSNNANYWTQPIWNALGQIRNLENIAETTEVQ